MPERAASGPSERQHDRPATRGRPCSVAASLDIIGDRWSLLVIRELHFGNHRFDDLVRNTGAPRDRISARLRILEERGIIERRLYHRTPARYEYHLTRAGVELAPVLRALRQWGDTWAVEHTPLVFEHSCGHTAPTVSVCGHCRQPVGDGDLRPVFVLAAWDQHGPKQRRSGARPERTHQP